MKTVTGEVFRTRSGQILEYNEQEESFCVGDQVSYDGLPYIVKRMVPPSRPEAKWSMEVILDYDSPHYCKVYEKEISDALCYETICGLFGIISSSSVPELTPYMHLDPLREKCNSCPYSDLGAGVESLRSEDV